MEPPKCKVELVEFSQIGVPTCIVIRAKQKRLSMLPVYVPVGGNEADRWGLSHLEPPKSQTTLIEDDRIFPDWSANMCRDKG